MPELESASRSENKSTHKEGDSWFVKEMPHTTNCSNDSSKSSLFTPTPPGCSTGDSGFLTTNIRDCMSVMRQPCASGVSRTVFHKQIDVDLLQGDAHARTLQVCQHDKLDVGRCFVVV